MTRAEAIKGLKVLRRDFSGYKPNEEMFDMAIEALEQEPKHGKWIEIIEEPYIVAVYCSECNTISTVEHKYCTNCGADMRGDEND